MIFIIQGFRIILFICFGRYVLRPSSDVSYWTWEPTQNFEPHPLFNPRDSLALIRVQVLSIPVLLLTCSQYWTCNFQMIVI